MTSGNTSWNTSWKCLYFQRACAQLLVGRLFPHLHLLGGTPKMALHTATAKQCKLSRVTYNEHCTTDNKSHVCLWTVTPPELARASVLYDGSCDHKRSRYFLIGTCDCVAMALYRNYVYLELHISYNMI